MKTTIVLVAAILCCGSLRASEIPARAQDHPIALVGGTIHPVSGPDILNGVVLFENGKITAVGANVTLPAGAEKIDVTGKQVYPGLVDARSVIGLTEIGSVRGTNDLSEVGSINPNVRAEVAVNPESEIIPVTRANGVTTAVTMPSGGTICGTAAALALDGWTWEEMTLRAPVGLVVNWPSMTINHAWWERRSDEEQRKARDNALAEIAHAFADARAYLKAKSAEVKGNVPYHESDVRWEAMAGAINGAVPVLVNADDLPQIEAAVAWGAQEHLKIVIMGGYDAWRVADLLKANDVPVVVSPVQRTPARRWEDYDAPCTLAKKLLDAGVRFCIAGEAGASNERNIPYHAAMAASYGLPKEEALKSVTLYAARILGIGDRVGSIEPGRDATLIVTNGDPLEIFTNVEMEFIAGKNVPLTTKHTRLYEKYRERYRRMGEGHAGEASGGR